MFEDYFGVFGDGTYLAMPKTIYAPDSSSLKPGSGATEGVLDKGVSAPGLYTLAGLLDYEDTRLKTLLCVEGKLGDSDDRSPSV